MDTPGLGPGTTAPSTSRSNKTAMGAIGGVDPRILFVVEAVTLADAKVLSLFKPGIPTAAGGQQAGHVVHRRAELALAQEHLERHPFAEFVPMSAKNKGDIERLFGICAKYPPEQPLVVMARMN